MSQQMHLLVGLPRDACQSPLGGPWAIVRNLCAIGWKKPPAAERRPAIHLRDAEGTPVGDRREICRFSFPHGWPVGDRSIIARRSRDHRSIILQSPLGVWCMYMLDKIDHWNVLIELYLLLIYFFPCIMLSELFSRMLVYTKKIYCQINLVIFLVKCSIFIFKPKKDVGMAMKEIFCTTTRSIAHKIETTPKDPSMPLQLSFFTFIWKLAMHIRKKITMNSFNAIWVIFCYAQNLHQHCISQSHYDKNKRNILIYLTFDILIYLIFDILIHLTFNILIYLTFNILHQAHHTQHQSLITISITITHYYN